MRKLDRKLSKKRSAFSGSFGTLLVGGLNGCLEKVFAQAEEALVAGLGIRSKEIHTLLKTGLGRLVAIGLWGDLMNE